MTNNCTTLGIEIDGSSDQLSAALMPVAANFHVVSFDIFDTLVERVINPANQVKRLAAHHLTQSVSAFNTEANSVDRILKWRDEIETALREEAAHAGHDHECRFSQIAELLGARLVTEFAALEPLQLGATKLSALIIQSELIAEQRVLRLRPGIATLLGELRSKGTRVVAVSDMYLDGEFIQRLLADLGIAKLIDAIYVSADHRLGKYSGRLFTKVFERESISPDQFIHIGDNRHSDFTVPTRLGASAVFLKHPLQQAEQATGIAHRWLAERNRYWRGVHLMSGIPASTHADFFYQYGFNVLGPIYASFVASAREAMIRRGTTHAFFLARDGELFYHLHQLFDSALGDFSVGPTISYLHISRRAVALPSMWQGTTKKQLALLLPRMRTQGLMVIANLLDLPLEGFSSLATRLGLSAIDAPLLADDRDWTEEIANDQEFQQFIRRHAAPARDMLRKHLEQEGLLGANRRVALVDIGWNGSIQRGLIETFANDTNWPEVTGLYLSFNDNLGHELNLDESLGVLYDKRLMHPKHNVFEHFEEIFENGARALDATTTGYQIAEDGIVVPCQRSSDANDRKAEIAFNPLAASLRDGAFEFGTQFSTRYANYGYSADDCHGYVVDLAKRAIFFPTHAECQQLFRVVHSEDTGSDSVMTLANHQLSGPMALMHPFRLMSVLKKSDWKYGTGRSLRIPGFNVLLRFVHLIMIWRGQARGRELNYRSLPQPRWFEVVLLKIVRWGGLPLLHRLRAAIGKRK